MKKKQVLKETEYEKNDDEDVVVTDEEIHQYHTHNSSVEGATWGVLFIFGGILLLLNMFGLVPFDIWHTLLRFWPVLIIIVGIQMIFGSSKIGRIISSIISVALLAWVVLIALHESAPGFVEKLPKFFKQPIEWWEVLVS